MVKKLSTVVLDFSRLREQQSLWATHVGGCDVILVLVQFMQIVSFSLILMQKKSSFVQI